mmetsp:Transcript_34450/g.40289  ORF Transcript_34450/g.40289 Transcript_34450/m.40289 type:complete len:477 (+) Transcript_34450:147-1577(+)|eukprot:CAMPEP_0176447660 /NCGR_PEP_ID=MMETSP0127-20121128/25202_1 /TAXON_ID=938130 /ORGANISM="Platyophrya macrostoma, Strain WH" /LENGTH=476 /DNA_ID=CAMNT_0017834225 /DNA_START=146 /DNA_END=1576 /DNA_ORIENTATION=+
MVSPTKEESTVPTGAGGDIPQTEEAVLAEAVVRLRGLPFNATENELRTFADGFSIADPNGVLLLTHGDGRGEAYIRFTSQDVAVQFQKERNRQNVGERYVEIYLATNADMERALEEEIASGSLTKNPIVRLRGLPFVASHEDVMRFFNKIAEKVVDLRFVEDADGRRTGDAFLELSDEDAVKVALTKHRLLMGTRYIEVTVSSAADRETVLHVASRRCRGQRMGHQHQNASQFGNPCFPGMGFGMFPPMLPMPALPKVSTLSPTSPAAAAPTSTGESSASSVNEDKSNSPNGIPHPTVSVQIGKAAASAAAATQAAQAAASFMMRAAMFGMVPPPFPVVLGSMPTFPPMMPMMPPMPPMNPPTAPRPQSRFIVRVRGLPFSATEATVAEFFSDVRIPPQGVHMVYNPQERPTGEAFVEVESEEDIATALEHNGAPLGHRYIEVFKSSPSDMMRLGGGSAAQMPDPFGMMMPYGMFY